MIEPYSLLAGAIAVDFGGRRGSATAVGLIDTAGYVGAVLSGYAVGSTAQSGGWDMVFRSLALIGAVAVAAAGVSWHRAQQATLSHAGISA